MAKLDYGLKPLKFWCQKVLPLVYDESLSYEELLCKVVAYLNEVIEGFNELPEYIQTLVSEDKLKEILSSLLNNLEEQVTIHNEKMSETASVDMSKGELVWLDGKLYQMTRNILAGDRYITESSEGVTANVSKITIEDIIGNLTSLKTSTQLSLVNAINELYDSLVSESTTREQADTSLSNAISNEAITREQGDTSLSNAISNEASAREQADTSLSNAISNEANTREQADTSLENAISNETSAREQADTSLSNSLNTLRTTVLAYKRVIIGDSYNVASVVTPTFGALLNDYLGDCTGFGYGARGFATSNSFYDAFSADLGSITNKNDYKEVVVCGGANDVGQTYANIKIAIANFNTLVKTNFPNAVLKVGFVGWSRYANDSWNNTFRFYKQACEELGVPYLNGVEIPLHNVKYLQTGDDHHHPNANGSYALARAIANALLTGSADYEELQHVIITQSGTHLIPTSAQYLYTGVKNGILSVNCKGIIYGNNGGTESGSTPLPVDSWVTIGTCEDSFLSVFGLENTERTVHAITGLLWDNKTKYCPLEFLIYGGGVVAIKNVSGEAISSAFGGEILPFSVSLPVTD